MNKTDVAPLIVIVGQTASGKSSLAHTLAKKYNGEIICADSRTIFEEMDIGTAKPSTQERQEVPYWGLDLIAPNTHYNAAQFKTYAEVKIRDITKRGKLPIMVGGTGLYIDSVLFDYTFGTEKDPEIRRLLDNKTIPELLVIAQNKGLTLPASVLKNKRHLVSAIERGDANVTRQELRNNTLIIGINPERKSIRYNIEQRVDAMFRKGLRKEVEEISIKYGWESEAMTGIGYKEFRQWHDNEISMSQVKKNIVKNTLQYAKRQRTWFKRNQAIEWFETSEDAQERVVQYIEKELY